MKAAEDRKRTVCVFRSGKLVVLLLCFCVVSVQAATPDEIQRWLQAHNRYRALHGVEPVIWSDRLAAGAEAFARTCPSAHGNSPYGENLAWASLRLYEQGVVDMWYEEEADYNYAAPGFSPTTGHFTQVVWKATREIGCGHASGCPGLDNVWVCRYNSPGNYRSLFGDNVLPPRPSVERDPLRSRP